MGGMDGQGDGRLDGHPLAVVTARDLADAIEEAARGMTQAALQRATGLSARTLRDLLAGTDRRFGRATINKLDEALGWPPGHAWRLYRQQRPPTEVRLVEVIAGQMDQIAARVATLEETPTWAGEVLDAFRPLRPSDRAALLVIARRLGSS